MLPVRLVRVVVRLCTHVPSWQVIALQSNPESKQQSFMQRLSGYQCVCVCVCVCVSVLCNRHPSPLLSLCPLSRFPLYVVVIIVLLLLLDIIITIIIII